MAWIRGVGLTPFGRQPGRDALAWQSTAALLALDDARLRPSDVDALYAGYATTSGHLMPGGLLAERLGAQPAVAAGLSAGGATGLAMVAAASRLVDAGQAEVVLVAGGEDRASGQSTVASTRTLAQVGHRDYEVPTGCTVPGYYGLLASAYLHRFGLGREALAPLAVQMRAHATLHPGAHHRQGITVEHVLTSRPVAEPLHLLDCCPVSDGGAAFVVSARPLDGRSVRILGVGEGHRHQHICEADADDFGAGLAASRALRQAERSLADVDVLGIYDSFTITLALLLEEIGFVERGRSGTDAAAGRFGRDGELPLNTHGGLLSYGHCGVAGGMAHVAEVVTQLRGEASDRQLPQQPRTGFVHADGGVMSAHVSAVLEVP